MKSLEITHLSAVAAALILEALPYGAVLNFAVAPESGGGTNRRTFSYFSMMPFGYANFGPLLTALITVLLAVLVLISCFGENRRKLCSRIGVVSAAAVLFSIAPLMFGLSYYSVVGLIITLLLIAFAVLGFARAKNDE